MNTTKKSMWRYVAGIALTALILYLIWYFSSVVIYILVSAVLAIMGRPLVNQIVKIKFCFASIGISVIYTILDMGNLLTLCNFDKIVVFISFAYTAGNRSVFTKRIFETISNTAPLGC